MGKITNDEDAFGDFGDFDGVQTNNEDEKETDKNKNDACVINLDTPKTDLPIVEEEKKSETMTSTEHKETSKDGDDDCGAFGDDPIHKTSTVDVKDFEKSKHEESLEHKEEFETDLKQK